MDSNTDLDAANFDDKLLEMMMENAFSNGPDSVAAELPELDTEEAQALATVDPESLIRNLEAAKQDGKQDDKAAKGAVVAGVADPKIRALITMRCVFCHDDLQREEAVYCAGCLAQHHLPCFESHGGCSILNCGGQRFLRPEDLRPRRPRRRSSRRIIIGVAIGLGLSGAGVAAWNASRPELLENPLALSESIRPASSGTDLIELPVFDRAAFEKSGKDKIVYRGKSEAGQTVAASLSWLERHQDMNGSWDSDGWSEQCKDSVCSGLGHNRGALRYDVGITGLATLAFLGNGHTHRFGKFKKTVRKSLDWLKDQQRADGSIGIANIEKGTIVDGEMYNHAFATMALCEAFAVSRDFKLKKYAQRAIDFCLRAQNPGGGWRYAVKPGESDSSITGCMVMALKSGATGGLRVPAEAFEGARRWFKSVTTKDARVGYMRPGKGSSFNFLQRGYFDEQPTLTAVGVISRIFCGERRTGLAIRLGTEVLDGELPVWSRGESARKTNFFYWYFGTYAMFQTGGDPWKRWRAALEEALLTHNRKGGCVDGSWDPVGEWCIGGGRVYATAINALSLEIFLRYDRAMGK